MRRVVLDTNIVLSALLFTSGRLAWIRHAWQGRQLQPLVCRETVNELLLVPTCGRLGNQKRQPDARHWAHGNRKALSRRVSPLERYIAFDAAL